MAHMEKMMNPKAEKNQTDPMIDPMIKHCNEMPNMSGCEQYR